MKLLRPEFSRIFEIFQNFGDVESSRFLVQRNIYGMSLEYLWNMTGTGDFKSNIDSFFCDKQATLPGNSGSRWVR